MNSWVVEYKHDGPIDIDTDDAACSFYIFAFQGQSWEILPVPRDHTHVRMSPSNIDVAIRTFLQHRRKGFVYRLRNTATREIIAGEIFT